VLRGRIKLAKQFFSYRSRPPPMGQAPPPPKVQEKSHRHCQEMGRPTSATRLTGAANTASASGKFGCAKGGREWEGARQAAPRSPKLPLAGEHGRSCGAWCSKGFDSSDSR